MDEFNSALAKSLGSIKYVRLMQSLVRRTWTERLFTLPWRPWVAYKIPVLWRKRHGAFLAFALIASINVPAHAQAHIGEDQVICRDRPLCGAEGHAILVKQVVDEADLVVIKRVRRKGVIDAGYDEETDVAGSTLSSLDFLRRQMHVNTDVAVAGEFWKSFAGQQRKPACNRLSADPFAKASLRVQRLRASVHPSMQSHVDGRGVADIADFERNRAVYAKGAEDEGLPYFDLGLDPSSMAGDERLISSLGGEPRVSYRPSQQFKLDAANYNKERGKESKERIRNLESVFAEGPVLRAFICAALALLIALYWIMAATSEALDGKWRRAIVCGLLGAAFGLSGSVGLLLGLDPYSLAERVVWR